MMMFPFKKNLAEASTYPPGIRVWQHARRTAAVQLIARKQDGQNVQAVYPLQQQRLPAAITAAQQVEGGKRHREARVNRKAISQQRNNQTQSKPLNFGFASTELAIPFAGTTRRVAAWRGPLQYRIGLPGISGSDRSYEYNVVGLLGYPGRDPPALAKIWVFFRVKSFGSP